MQCRDAVSGTAARVPAAGPVNRREFLALATLGAAAVASGCAGLRNTGPDPIIDIHQHVGYSGRSDEALLAHQKAMRVTLTILLPAGRPQSSASTHDGTSNGLQAGCYGNQACYRLCRANPRACRFAANDVPDAPGAEAEIVKYLKLGAVAIAEQKFGVECDSKEMQRLYELAAEYDVPILMHWQHGRFNHGFERFYKMLEKYPRTRFIGHAQTWWANIDKNHLDQSVLYPKGPVVPGGLTDRYLTDYENVYADLSAGSGLNALTRDEAFTRDFFRRHASKLLYGSDCNDSAGAGEKCQGAQTLAAVRRLAPDKTVERQILYSNARRVFRGL